MRNTENEVFMFFKGKSRYLNNLLTDFNKFLRLRKNPRVFATACSGLPMAIPNNSFTFSHALKKYFLFKFLTCNKYAELEMDIHVNVWIS